MVQLHSYGKEERAIAEVSSMLLEKLGCDRISASGDKHAKNETTMMCH